MSFKMKAALGMALLSLACGGGAGSNTGTGSGTGSGTSTGTGNTTPVTTTELREGAPDFEGVSLALDSSDDGTAALIPDSMSEQSITLVRTMNHRLKEVFLKIEHTMTSGGEPTISGDSGTFTATTDEAGWKLVVTRKETKRFEFEFFARPADSTADGDYKSVAKGFLARGEVARRGGGYVELDLTKRHEVNPTAFPSLGMIRVRFAHGAAQKRMKVKAKDYQETDSAEKINAGFSYVRLANGKGGLVRIAGKTNVWPDAGDGSAEEKVVAVVRWIKNFRGRMDAIAWSGDIDSDKWARRVECWNDRSDLSYSNTFVGTKFGSAPVTGQKKGDADSCPAGLKGMPKTAELPDDETLAEDIGAADDILEADQSDEDSIPELTAEEGE